jgi:hypothetical protein
VWRMLLAGVEALGDKVHGVNQSQLLSRVSQGLQLLVQLQLRQQLILRLQALQEQAQLDLSPLSQKLTQASQEFPGTGAVGSVSVTAAANTSVTGNVGTSAIGTITVDAAGTAVVTGVSGTASVGSVTTDAAANVSVTGLEATSALGTISSGHKQRHQCLRV